MSGARRATPTHKHAAFGDDVEFGMRCIIGRSLCPVPTSAPTGVVGVVRYINIPLPVRRPPTVGAGAPAALCGDVEPDPGAERDADRAGTAPANVLSPRTHAHDWRSTNAEVGAGQRRFGVRRVGEAREGEVRLRGREGIGERDARGSAVGRAGVGTGKGL